MTTSTRRTSSEKMKEMGLFGATISEAYGGLGLPVTTYAKVVERLSHGLDVGERPHQLAPHHGRRGRALRHRRAAAGLPAPPSPAASSGAGSRSPSRTAAPTCRPNPHHGASRRQRRLYHQRRQDLDHQQHPRLLPRAAGQDRPRRRASPQGHEPLPRREGRGLSGQPQAGEAGLSRDRHRRARLRGLSHRRRQAHRRGRGQGPPARAERPRARPHQRGRPAASASPSPASTRRCAIPSNARPSASRSASIRRSRSSSPTWSPAPRPRGC